MINQNYGSSGNRRSTTPNVPVQSPTSTGSTWFERTVNSMPRPSANTGSYNVPFGTMGAIGSQVGGVPQYNSPYVPKPYNKNVDLSTSAWSKRTDYLGSEGLGPNRAKAGTTNPVVLGSEGYGPRGVKRPAPPPPVDPNVLGSEGYGPNGVKNFQQRAIDEAAQQEAAEQAQRDAWRRAFSSLDPLLPEQQMAYREAIRGAEREFELMRNQVRLGRQTARRDFRQGVREVGRQQAGGSQDLATALAYLGMDTSPATMGVGLQDIERQADLARSELAKVKAMQLGQLDERMTQARIGRTRARSQAEMNKSMAKAANSLQREKYRFDNPEMFL